MNFKSAIASLGIHRKRLEAISTREMFVSDRRRFARFSLTLDELVFDYSKNRIDANAIAALQVLARDAGVESRRDAMFAGAAINITEGRAVLHTALRNSSTSPVMIDGHDVMPGIRKVLAAMRKFAGVIRAGGYKLSGGAVTDIVNIGIGGSDLGPAMAVRALSPYADGPRLHFVSNVDSADLADILKQLDAGTTFFIIASKTFTTAETMANARSARSWVVKSVGKANAGRHFAALSTNLAATRAFGIDDQRTFGFWDWVGGRYSIWSAIGLSLMIAIGPRRFSEFLAGANLADRHFCVESPEKNIPIIMALLGIWHRNVWGFATHAVLPYDNRLGRLPAYLQQLDMESNGKHVTLANAKTAYDTAPVVWGEPGTNGQHAFYQLIHQGTSVVPCDFLVAAKPHEKMGNHHTMLVANCLAQSEALMNGRALAEVVAEMRAKAIDEKLIRKVAPHRVFEGSRPSNTFLYRKLTPKMLGMLIALYEHKVFVQGVIWNVNSFDQWGVELGKVLAAELVPLLSGDGDLTAKDASTQGLIASLRRLSGK